MALEAIYVQVLALILFSIGLIVAIARRNVRRENRRGNSSQLVHGINFAPRISPVGCAGEFFNTIEIQCPVIADTIGDSHLKKG